MMALESGDKNTALNAVVDTIEACISDPIDKNDLSIFDIEYMFIMIRSKSVGEISGRRFARDRDCDENSGRNDLEHCD